MSLDSQRPRNTAQPEISLDQHAVTPSAVVVGTDLFAFENDGGMFFDLEDLVELAGGDRFPVRSDDPIHAIEGSWIDRHLYL
jgi:hypothetical protein